MNPEQGPADATTGSNPLNSSHVANGNGCLNATDESSDCGPAITQNRTIPLSYPGRPIHVSWENTNQTVGPNNSYITSRSSLADEPRWALFVSQLNATFVPLTNLTGNSASFVQPNMSTFAGDPVSLYYYWFLLILILTLNFFRLLMDQCLLPSPVRIHT